MKPFVNNWRYENGWQDIPVILQDKNGPITNTKFFNEEIVGWHCWVYPSNDVDFEGWMKQNMKGDYDCTFRFNSGNPMFTVLITDDEDATLFKLTWM